MNSNLLRCAILCLSLGLSLSTSAQSTGAHDPVMAKEGDTYYLFHTGRGVQAKSSKDMKTWKQEPSVFAEAPAWIKETIPKWRGDIWAPDIFFHDGTYYLYYSVSAFGRNTSAIGVATNTTLKSGHPDFKWVDHGIVVQSVPGRDLWNAIDANVLHDAEGTPWMSFGSFWTGLKLVKLNDDLLSIATGPDQEWHTIAARERDFVVDERDAGDAANPELDYDALYSKEQLARNKNMQSGAIEAPFIFKKGDYYYLFVSWDRCCRGLESTYKIAVGRSKDIRGPYLDEAGKKMIHGGGTLIAVGNDDWAAVGHQSAYTFDGTDYLVFHGYDKKDRGRPKLIVREIHWSDDGWPGIDL